ncbi:serine protease [Haloplanus rubicundus]|uniref:Serine protease n=1 Tax=Haloplanus rubicundus TaxID=1547898 RepID=A0A345E265_9EURY|nr:S8 family peptidase [Haloplanus rubicundus]AXG06287.1 serine protease [Haloplanus rubicundus]
MGTGTPQPGSDSLSDDAATDDSPGTDGATRRQLLVGLTTGAAAIGLGASAAAEARGPNGNGAGNNRPVRDNAAGNNDRVEQGRGPPDQVIVGTTTQAAADEAAQQAREVRHKLDFGNRGKAVAGRFPEPAQQALQNRPDVRYVEPDATFEAIGETVPWGVDRIDADAVHDGGTTGDGADIAIIDTGIDSDHPDLIDNLGLGKAYVEAGTDYDGSSCSGNGNTYHEPWDDDNDHGTHCAGTAAGVANSEGVIGTAPGATLHAVKVLACSGTGYLSDIAAGVEYTTNQGWDVASLSLGSSSDYSTLQDACQYAVDKGVLVIAAAGNDGPCSDCVSYPAKYDTVVAVSATDSSDDLASFSSTGPEIDIAAPGSSIRSTVPGGFAYFSGTSMACPHVSGVGGLLMANGYTGHEARSALQGNTEDIGLSGSDGGNGLLNAEAAVPFSTELSISTLEVSDIEADSAVLNGTLESLGGADSVEVYFKYWEKGSKSSTVDWTSVETLTSPGAFSDSLSDLSSGTTYIFAARGKSSTGDWNSGSHLDFIPRELSIQTEEVSVSSSGTTLNGTLESLGGADSVEVYFKYWEKGSKSSTVDWTSVETLTSPGAFSDSLSDLSSGTTYIFAARGKSSTGDWNSGSHLEFSPP